MAIVHPFPNQDQREVLRQVDTLANEFHLCPRQRQAARTRFLRDIEEGRSTAVAVSSARRVIKDAAPVVIDFPGPERCA